MKHFFHFLFFAIILSCTNEEHIDEKFSIPESSTDSIETEVIEKKAFSARLIFTDSIGWGYQIFDGNTMVINQIHIPSIQGNIGFKSRESAQLAANFILYKLSNGVFPPTVDEKELDSLGVL